MQTSLNNMFILKRVQMPVYNKNIITRLRQKSLFSSTKEPRTNLRQKSQQSTLCLMRINNADLGFKAQFLPFKSMSTIHFRNNRPENLLDFVDILQQELIRAGVLPADYDFEAHKELVPMQPGDVPVTYADTSALERDFGFKPSTSLRSGLRAFAEWYAEFYRQESKIR